MDELIVISRAFVFIVFMGLVGFLVMIVVSSSFVAWRRIMAASFAVLCLGITVKQATRITYGSPWNWWATFALVSAILATIGFYAAWRDRGDS